MWLFSICWSLWILLVFTYFCVYVKLHVCVHTQVCMTLYAELCACSLSQKSCFQCKIQSRIWEIVDIRPENRYKRH